MGKVINLVKILFKLNINIKENKKIKNKAFLIIGFGIYILFIFSSYWKQFITPLEKVGHGELAINLILSVSYTLIFMTSITYIINILYFSNDTEYLIPFPIKSREIFSAKLIVAYLYELMIASMIVLPGFITYGIMLYKGVLYYLFASIVFLFIPVLPIAILTIIYTLIMRVFKLNKYKNVFQILTTILILAVFVLSQMALNANMLDNGEYDGNYILELCNNTNIYPFKIAEDVFYDLGSISSILSLIWFVAINIFLVFIIVYCFDKLFINIISNGTIGLTKNAKKGKVRYYKKSLFDSIVSIELKKLFRNVTFFIQCVLPTTFMPAIILVSLLTSRGNTLDFNPNDNVTTKMLFAFLVVQFFMMMNQISATAISRDGENESSFYKSMPIRKMMLLDAKAMPSIIVGLFNLIFAVIFDLFIFELNAVEIIQVVIVGILLNLVQSYLYLLIDYKNPKFNWTSEMAVVKHNLNVYKAIGIWFLIIIVTSLIGNVFLILNIGYFSVAFILILALAFYGIRRKFE